MIATFSLIFFRQVYILFYLFLFYMWYFFRFRDSRIQFIVFPPLIFRLNFTFIKPACTGCTNLFGISNTPSYLTTVTQNRKWCIHKWQAGMKNRRNKFVFRFILLHLLTSKDTWEKYESIYMFPSGGSNDRYIIW